MLQLADEGQVGLVVHGLLNGKVRSLSYRGGGEFQADPPGETWTTAQLRATAGGGGPQTWTVVPLGSTDRLGAGNP